ncbi:MAG: helix-turn-helix transcriptional regulator [Candidatus Heimdallarchaeota archaeon]|nr:MAG: helix-turn-helix transcriptional regulator [Candidatus Heimdallarchaeota archaeon]
MSSQPSPLPLRIFRVLQDETRLAIFICLIIYQKLTVKQLADFLHKGKTTISHHLRKMDEAGIVNWEEREEDKKKLKTRFFFLNYEIIEKRKDWTQEEIDLNRLPEEEKLVMKASLFDSMKTEALVTSNIMEWMIKYSEALRDTTDLSSLDKHSQSFIRTFSLTPETLPIYQEAIQKIEETLKNSTVPVTHISSHVLIPIKDILEWKQKQKIE